MLASAHSGLILYMKAAGGMKLSYKRKNKPQGRDYLLFKGQLGKSCNYGMLLWDLSQLFFFIFFFILHVLRINM